MSVHDDADRSSQFRAALAGDRAAYARFLSDVATVVRGIVRARGSRLDEATQEDVVQEVLLAIHAKRHTWRQSDPVEPWLYAITRYKVADEIRRVGHKSVVALEEHGESLHAPMGRDPTDGRDAMRVIQKLEGRARDIVIALGIKGASVRETARHHKMTENAVRVSLHRSLKRLATLRTTMIE